MPIYKMDGEKRNGLQKYRVVLNYTDQFGKKKTIERRIWGKGQAKEEEERLRLLTLSGQTPEAEKKSRETVETLWEDYKSNRGRELRASSMDKKTSIVNTHIKPLLWDRQLSRLTKTDMTEWRDWMSKKEIGVVMKNNALRELRCLLNYAVETGKMGVNPANKIKRFRDPYKKTDGEKIRYMTKEDFLKYIAEGQKFAKESGTLNDWGIYVFFNLAYYTGMRKGEINALRWEDVDGTTIAVRRSITQKLTGEPIIETPPKNESSVRRLTMPKPLIAVLDEHRKRQMESAGWRESWRVCGGPSVIPDTTLDLRNRKFADAAGVKRITIHEFRHSHASLLCNAGVNIKEIARRLGHSNVQITWKTYSHLYPAEEERAVEILNQIE